jgi:CubicO group peptidase (beta-lactamase class C family)
LVAEIDGYSSPCALAGRRLEAAIGHGLGRFKGDVTRDGDIEGHWIQPDGTMIGSYASPVFLKRKAAGLWAGDIKPLEDVADMFLVVSKTQDGSLSAFLRNPERNLGIFLKASKLDVQGEQVRVLDSSGKQLATGSYDSDNQVLALYFPADALALAFTRVDQNNASDFRPRPTWAQSYQYVRPRSLADGWDVAGLKDEGLSASMAKRFIQGVIDAPDVSVHSLNPQAILLARNGKLVLEEYFHGYSVDRPHDTRSAAKSITSVLAGIAMDRDPSLKLSTPIVSVLKKRTKIDLSDPRKRRITVQNLLTMSAGLDCDDHDPKSPGNEDTMQSQTKDKDYYHYAINQRMVFEPGEKAVYGSALPNLLGGVISTKTGMWLPEFFRDYFARPLDIEDYYLPLQPTGEAYMGGGMFLKPRDFLKLGQLMLNGGTWHGRRVISKRYVEEASKPRYGLEGVKYGFFWWVIDYPFRGSTLRAYYAAGNGGQVVMVIPKLKMVFECLAGNYSDKVMFQFQREWVPKYVLPMVESSK